MLAQLLPPQIIASARFRRQDNYAPKSMGGGPLAGSIVRVRQDGDSIVMTFTITRDDDGTVIVFSLELLKEPSDPWP